MDELLDIPVNGASLQQSTANNSKNVANSTLPITKNTTNSSQQTTKIDPTTIETVASNTTNQRAAMTLPDDISKAKSVVPKVDTSTITSPNDNQQPSANLGVPDVNQMEQSLQQGGMLLNEISVQNDNQKTNETPLASLQPDNMLNTKGGPQPINIPSTREKQLQNVILTSSYAENLAEKLGININSLERKSYKLIKNTVAIALTIQGLFGIYKSIKFILVDYPALEVQLLAHQITKTQINSYATHAIIMLVTTIIAMIFALRIMRSKATKVINILIGIGLFFGSAYLDKYLTTHFDLATLISNPILTVAEGFSNVKNDLINKIPFLEKDINGNLEVVWYK